MQTSPLCGAFLAFRPPLKRLLLSTVITGFNTDVQHEGVTYHVQTEDKGLDTPLILSLVYVGGAILASKRTPYEDLIKSGFDEKVLTERLQRQHKLICAAIKSGRVEDLKRMGDRDAQPAAVRSEEPSSTEVNGSKGRAEKVAPRPRALRSVREEVVSVASHVPPVGPVPPVNPPVATPLEEVAVAPEDALPTGAEGTRREELCLSLFEESELRAGQLAVLKIRAARVCNDGEPVSNAQLTIKVLGTSFRPLILSTKTDSDGVAIVRALLPRFTSGRAAVIIRASADGEDVELRRIIHQS